MSIKHVASGHLLKLQVVCTDQTKDMYDINII